MLYSSRRAHRRRALSAQCTVLICGSTMLATLLAMSLGTALLPADAQEQTALLVVGGLLVLLGSALWLLHKLTPAEPPRQGRDTR